MNVTICGFKLELPETLTSGDKDKYASLETEHDVTNVEGERRVLLATIRQRSTSVQKYTKLSERAWSQLEKALNEGGESDLLEKRYDEALERLSQAEARQDLETLEDNEKLSELNRKSNLFYLAYLHYLASTYEECGESLSDWNFKATLEDYSLCYQVIEKKYLLLSVKKSNKVLLDSTANTLRKLA